MLQQTALTAPISWGQTMEMDPGSDSLVAMFAEAECKLFNQLVMRAINDVRLGTRRANLEGREKGELRAQRALEKAEEALGWIFGETDTTADKCRCGDEPCVLSFETGHEKCRCWCRDRACYKLTFEEACSLNVPPLNAGAIRDQLRSTLRQAGVALE